MGGLRAADLDVERIGDGPPVVFVHGSIVGPRQTWRAQRALAARWTLVLPHRPGFGASPPLPRGDFEAEAPLIAELLGDGAHLVGHSYGAVIALHAAALRPQAVWSLTVTEPGTLRVAAGDPQVDQIVAWGEQLYRHRDELSPRDFVQLFRGGAGSSHATPEQMPEWLARGAAHVMAERPPWESDPPLAELAAASFPKLVISGRHSPVFEAVCDVVAERIGAERATASGGGHSIPLVGEPYNALLEDFLRRTGRCARAAGAGP
ncbi:MAG: alpha/beta fold hydrolase [Actinobacteria bacterium]|nr:alpha/beta fold hydrolase [Actinomycetota bacterium]